MKSILQNRRECWLTRVLNDVECVKNLERHHVFGGNPNRRLSEKYGLTVYLSHDMHNEPPSGVHCNKRNREMLQRFAQRKAMAHYGWTEQEFMQIFGKNYLNESGLDIWPEEEWQPPTH